MNEFISSKLSNGQPLTMPEVEVFLNHVVDIVRTKTKITDIYNTDCAKCDSTSTLVALNMFENNCDCEMFPFKQVMGIDLTHYASIASVYTVDGLKWFLIDLTYIQFFRDKYTLDNGKTINFKKHIITDDQIKMGNSLIKNGYVELTEENFKMYIDEFLDAYNDVILIDKNQIYEKINDYMEKRRLGDFYFLINEKDTSHNI